MRVAILADIHGNLEALEAVLEDSARLGCARHACLGDLVGFCADAVGCVDRVRALNCPVVRGDFDETTGGLPDFAEMNPVAAAAYQRDWELLGPERREWLRHLPVTLEMEGFTLVHSTLDQPTMWSYVFSRFDAMTNFSYQATQVAFHGHTHVPRVFRMKERSVEEFPPDNLRLEESSRYFINVGSVGQPRDGDPRACYAIHDVKQRTVIFRRVDYDLAKAQRKILDSGLPPLSAERLEAGR